MTRVVAICSIVAVLLTGIVACVVEPISSLFGFFAANLRGSFFSGFLTVGGFLFSLKTFIVVKMKEELYEHELYKRRLEKRRELNPKLTSFGPLRRLSRFLFVSVIASFVTAILQVSVGLWPHWIAALICMGAATFTLSMLVVSLVQIKGNLDEWFELLEESARNPPAEK